MIWKNFISPLAITPRRRVVATALVYGLSLAVRFTSATGDEAEIPPQAAQRTNPMTSIMINDGAQLFQGLAPEVRSADCLSRGWPLASRGCRAACERPMPIVDADCPLHKSPTIFVSRLRVVVDRNKLAAIGERRR